MTENAGYTLEEIVSLAQQEIEHYKMPLTASERDGNLLIEARSADVTIEEAQPLSQALFDKLAYYVRFGLKSLEFGDNLPLVEPGPVVDGGEAKRHPFLRLVK